MTEREFPKRFDFREAEPRIYQSWLDAQAFRAAYDQNGQVVDEARKDAAPFVVVIPPPNITGRLHMGHALNNTVQDVMVRTHRLKGRDALWVPGTDHAGIATQTVVKKQLDAQGLDFRALGRDEVVRRIWEWRNQYGDAILGQLRKMGCSCDWSRTRFTMDEGLNLAVRESFVRLYEQGLIYRGKRIVNWCPIDRTALSDDEVEKEDEKGKMYHLRYPLADGSGHLVVATTRPETMFGDVAVAVHPENLQLKHFIGQTLRLPLQGRLIPVIADEHADPEKGTGAVKITPAHDPNDFEVGLRHGLEPINVMNEDASLNEVVPPEFRGLGRYAARKKVLESLEQQGLLEAVKDHVLAIGRSYRSKEPIEFRLSDQWFVKMAPLAEKALLASGYEKSSDGWVRKHDPKLNIYPERYEKVYFHWLSNIRDWCISRQIWWGHRIPAWFHLETGECLVAKETPARVAAEPEKWRQDEDVLDTWFSSWLWPMSVFGWPQQTPDLARYYPTSVLSTAKDILFFWVARMNFAGLEFEARLPYRDVYLHSTIADDQGVTMSKSKGNGIDPTVVVEGGDREALERPVYEARPSNMKELLNRVAKNFPNGFEAVGADGMRWTLIYSITEGEHVRLSLPRFTEGRNFVTKLWNGAGRVITTLESEASGPDAPVAPETDEDRWILARLDTTIRQVEASFERYDFGSLAQTLYHFVWDDYCAWALELFKTRFTSENEAVRRGALKVLGSVLADMLRLLHPIIPFVTEALWSRLVPAMDKTGLWRDSKPQSALLVRDFYPRPRAEPQPELEARFDILMRFVNAVRSLRSGSGVKDSDKIVVQVKALHASTEPMLTQAAASVSFLAKLEGIEFVAARRPGMAAFFDPAFELYLDLARYVDLGAELARLDKEIVRSEKELATAQGTLANPAFIEKAPPEKVELAKAKVVEVEERLAKLKATRAELADLKA